MGASDRAHRRGAATLSPGHTPRRSSIRASLTLPTLSTGEATGEATTVRPVFCGRATDAPNSPHLAIKELFRKLVGM